MVRAINCFILNRLTTGRYRRESGWSRMLIRILLAKPVAPVHLIVGTKFVGPTLALGIDALFEANGFEKF